MLIEAAPPALAKRRRWPILAGTVLVVALALLVKIPMWQDDEKLGQLKERINMYPLPRDTEPDSYSLQGTVGIQSGNSNHCDFLVRMALLTKLPDEEIARYYEGAAVKGMEGGRLSGRTYINPRGSWREGYKAVIVEFFDGPHDAGWDARCH